MNVKTNSVRALREAGGQIATVLGASGAVATLFYAAGFMEQIAYFSAFGAPWLGREIASADIFRGGFEILPAVIVVIVGIAWVFRVSPREAPNQAYRRFAMMLLVAVIIIIAIDLVAGRYFLLKFRSVIDVAGAVAASLAAAYVAMSSLSHSSAENTASGFRTVGYGVIVVALVFCAVPVFAGRARAFYSLAVPARLPHVKTTNIGLGELPVIAVTQERLYCLPPQGNSKSLRVIKWDAVVSITPTDER